MGTALRRNGRVRIVVAFFSFFVFTILLSYGAYFLGGLRTTQESSVAREHPTITQNALGPQVNESAGRHSPNKRSQLIGMATQIANDSATAASVEYTCFKAISLTIPRERPDAGSRSRPVHVRRAGQNAPPNVNCNSCLRSPLTDFSGAAMLILSGPIGETQRTPTPAEALNSPKSNF